MSIASFEDLISNIKDKLDIQSVIRDKYTNLLRTRIGVTQEKLDQIENDKLELEEKYPNQTKVCLDIFCEFLDEFNPQLVRFSNLLSAMPEAVRDMLGDMFYRDLRMGAERFLLELEIRQGKHTPETLSESR